MERTNHHSSVGAKSGQTPPMSAGSMLFEAEGPAQPMSPPNVFSQVLIFTWRAIAKVRQTPEMVLDILVMPVLFTVMFTYLFGGTIKGSPLAYLHFLLPGVLAQTVMFTSVYTGMSINTDRDKGVYDRFRTMPIAGLAPIAGVMAGDLLRHLGSAMVVIGVGYVLGFRPEAGPAGVAVAVLLLLAFAFGISWLFAALALLVRTPSSVLTLGSLVIFPSTFVSNLMVEPATMPEWLQPIVLANPITSLVTALRAAMGGTLSADIAAQALVAPAIAALLFATISAVLFRAGR